MGCGIIISEIEPEMVNRYTWMKPLVDGSVEYYEPSDGGWALSKTIPAPASASHTHVSFGDINFTGNVSVGGDAGVTGQRLIPTVGTLIFKKGILTGFTPV